MRLRNRSKSHIYVIAIHALPSDNENTKKVKIGIKLCFLSYL